MTRRIRAVLFDRDDTLSVTDPAVYQAAADWVAGRFGLDAGLVHRALLRQWHEAFGNWWALRTLEDERVFWRRYGRELGGALGLSDVQGEAIVAQFPYQAFMKAAPGARELLRTLRSRGLKIGVLSNTLPDIWPTLHATALGEYVDVALSSCALGIHKPDPAAFELAAQALGVGADAVLFLDDKQENVDAARQVGMTAALVDLEGRAPGAISDLGDVVALLDGLEAAAGEPG
ncbi:HAD family phosphatase [Deinococcus sp.]|uniref:HAD family hydrolase n=1 Tax=Deinococcus sp. TaxID=47478 RepID=UPI0025D632D6|nr:HAD family phosphatase [Deinococcus sp.]